MEIKGTGDVKAKRGEKVTINCAIDPLIYGNPTHVFVQWYHQNAEKQNTVKIWQASSLTQTNDAFNFFKDANVTGSSAKLDVLKHGHNLTFHSIERQNRIYICHIHVQLDNSFIQDYTSVNVLVKGRN